MTGGNRSQLGGAGGRAANTAVVETVTPGGPAPTPAETVPPADGKGPDAAAPAEGQPSAGDATGGSAPAASPVIEPTTNATGEQPAKTDASASGDSQNADASKTDGSQSADDKKDSKKESSSKKKKGLRKVVPW